MSAMRLDDDFRPESPRRAGPPGSGRAPRRPRNLLFVGLVATSLAILVLFGQSRLEKQKTETLHDYLEFVERLRQGKFKKVELEGTTVVGTYKVAEEGAPAYAKADIPEKFQELPLFIEARQQAREKGTEFIDRQPSVLLYQFVLPLIPWLLLAALIWFFLFRQFRAPGGPGGVLSFGRSRARVASKDQHRVTFDDVAGINEAKEEVLEIIEFLKDPSKFQRLGGRMPRGVLLVGPPGTGKTLLAKAIAGEADVPFFSISGSDFVEMFVGVGASRVRDLFRQAKESSPCIIFLDEIDAVGRRRGSGLGGGHDEREQTLNAILVEMDGFDTDEGVIVLAATNRPDVLDPALLRPGRFDREIVIDAPDVKGREEILRVHARRVKLARPDDLQIVARSTPSFSGADLEAVINESALIAVMKKKDAVELEDLEEARDKVKWGRQKRSKVMDEADKRITAYHESGHALVAALLPEVEPLHKVTIIPRGVALGATMQLPERDRYHMQKRYCLGQLTVLFGGRAAEEAFCNDISAGARGDIKQATELARMMICEWGMSEALGPISYSEAEETLFLGREITRTRNHSEQTAQSIDREVQVLLASCLERSRQMIRDHRDACERIAQALLRLEVLSGTDVESLMNGTDPAALRPEPSLSSRPPSSAPRIAPAPAPVPRPAPGAQPSPGTAPA
jgi:cell division protease FtsH